MERQSDGTVTVFDILPNALQVLEQHKIKDNPVEKTFKLSSLFQQDFMNSGVGFYFTPVLPKPPSPLTESSSSSTTEKSAA